MRVEFSVPGVAIPQGSKVAFVDRRGDVRMKESSATALKRWRHAVGWAARAAHRGGPLPVEVPIAVKVTFAFLKPERLTRVYPCTGAGLDIEKLVRALHDAITGIVWTDDSQVVRVEAAKRYVGPGEAPGAHVVVRALDAAAISLSQGGTP